MIYDDSGAPLPTREARQAQADSTALRLLPWRGPSGGPCYLSTDNPDSTVSRMADEIEEGCISTAEEVLAGTKAVLEGSPTNAPALRFALQRTCEALSDLLLVAESRGERVSQSGCTTTTQ
ncbi:hypothetical protein ACFQLX_24635 [Streptomyces polyrhachis]|uniref:Uncharacterized protein n=1 Tax=Streptomyces polyrhachis TaxID=1282885 RepID=A0ABW2GQH0_9ACTN